MLLPLRKATTQPLYVFFAALPSAVTPTANSIWPSCTRMDKAVGVTRKRCWKYDWVLEFDIKGLFDNIDHALTPRAVRKHVTCKWALLYIERWLRAPMEQDDGARIERTCRQINPLLRGWLAYYGRYAPSALAPVLRYVNLTLRAWVMRKFKRFAAKKIRAGHFLERMAREHADLFVHWRMGMIGVFA